MSTFRKTVLTTAIIGAGLAATSGSAFASEHQSPEPNSASSGCSNLVEVADENGAGEVKRGDITGGDQDIQSSNLCNNLSGNEVLSGNNVALGGTVQNGDNKTVNTSEETVITRLTSITDLGL